MPVCPLCNSLTKVKKNCPVCGRVMRDEGTLQDYYDDYSPYLDMNIYENGYRCHDDVNCTHLFSCPQCRTGTYFVFQRIDKERLVD